MTQRNPFPLVYPASPLLRSTNYWTMEPSVMVKALDPARAFSDQLILKFLFV
jgi:hypothetical protein